MDGEMRKAKKIWSGELKKRDRLGDKVKLKFSSSNSSSTSEVLICIILNIHLHEDVFKGPVDMLWQQILLCD
jgi:hypothetical protein